MRFTLAALVAVISVVAWCGLPVPGQNQDAPKLQWIWHNDKNPVLEQEQGARYFRKVFTINRPVEKPVDEAILDITADDEFTAWVNGTQVGKGQTWQRV